MTRNTIIQVSCPRQGKVVDLDKVCWECPCYEGMNYNAEVNCTHGDTSK